MTGEIRMKNKVIAAAFGLFLGMSYVMEAFAQSPAALVRQRQAGMTLIGKYFGQMNPKAPYDAATFARNAGYLDTLDKMPWDGFVAATQTEKSRALPEVYTDAAKFKQAQDSFQAEVTKLLAATKGGNEQTVRAAWGEVNKSCNACHDAFRARAN
jgi:cytochrome c556